MPGWPVGFALVTSLAGVLSGSPAVAAPAARQTPPPATQAPPAQTPTPTPEPPAQSLDTPPPNLDHIKAALSHPPELQMPGEKLKFYLEVYGQPTPFWSFVGSYDLRNGPVKRAPITGQEFLDMMRPKELYSSAGITAPELLQFAVTNIAAQAIIRKAIQDIRSARTDAEVAEIRARIDRELRALKGGGQ